MAFDRAEFYVPANGGQMIARIGHGLDLVPQVAIPCSQYLRWLPVSGETDS